MTDIDEFVAMISTELHKAKAKFPVFCNDLPAAGHSLDIIRFSLLGARARSEAEREGGYSFENTINEEILEALEAYSAEDYKACLKELAQCGAVILRAMEFVKHKSRRQ